MMKPPPEPRSPDAPDRIYRPNAVAEMDRAAAPARTSVSITQVRTTLRRYRLSIRRRLLP